MTRTKNGTLTQLQMQKLPVRKIVMSSIVANKAGLNLSPERINTLYKSGRNVDNIIHGLVRARQRNQELSLEQAIKYDENKVGLSKEMFNDY